MPIVTRITEQKRRKNRRSVHLDGAFAFGCNVNVIARFRLREGMELSSEQVRQIEQGEIRQECLDDALRYLQSRLHSRLELRRKLIRREYGESVIDGVLDDLQRMDYVNDARFAKSRAVSAAEHRHYGRRRAFMELKRAGVDEGLVEEALDQVYSRHDSLETARQLARKQAPRLRKLDPRVARRRLAGMLQRRGFDYDAVKAAIDEVLA